MTMHCVLVYHCSVLCCCVIIYSGGGIQTRAVIYSVFCSTFNGSFCRSYLSAIFPRQRATVPRARSSGRARAAATRPSAATLHAPTAPRPSPCAPCARSRITALTRYQHALQACAFVRTRAHVVWVSVCVISCPNLDAGCAICQPGQVLSSPCTSTQNTVCSTGFQPNAAIVAFALPLTVLGVASCFALAVVFVRNRKHPVVRVTSPDVMLCILFGCAGCFSSLPTFVVSVSDVACALRAWLPSVSLTLSLSAILAKNFRIYTVRSTRVHRHTHSHSRTLLTHTDL